MVYKIDGSGPSHNSRVDNQRGVNKGSESRGSSETAKAGSAAPVDAPLAASAKAAINASDGIDRQKVDAIKNAIRNGEFEIDAKRVAQAFVDLEMLTGY